MGNELRRWRGRIVVFSIAGAALGCAPASSNGPVPLAHETVRQAPVRPAVVAQRLATSSVNPSPQTNAARLAGAVVDARVLVITGDGSDAAFGAIQSTLQYLGTPFDVLNATTGPTLTAAALATGNHGKYSAVFLDTGNLTINGASAFTTDEWTTLSTYEAQFGVRRVSLYTSPTAAYGLSDAGEVDPATSPVTMTCTAAGATTFVGANCANPIVVDQGWVYPATVADSTTTPLLVDAAGHVYAATHTTSDGREILALTFAHASYYNSYLELAYGLVSWATRGLFIGERHVYAVPQLDDLFLASALYTGPKPSDRITDADLQTFANWQNSKRAQPQFAGFRVAFACNGYGSQTMPGDPLTAKAIALGSTFAWINHTWDHPVLDNLSYADALSEFTKNDAYLKGLPLAPYASISAVTPNISGLSSADAMQAIHDAGIRYLVSDTSEPNQGNPSPNVGIWNALQPTVFEIPRIPTDLYFNVEDPSTWIPEYEALKNITGIDYPTIIDQQSDVLVSHMLAGNKDPWMFHQLNAYDYDGAGHSLLSDLLDATFTKYAAASTFPVSSPTQDELATIFINRMTFQASGVTATITPGASMTVSVANAATVPVTGLCTPGAENYGGQTISYLSLSAGQSVTLSLADCNGGGGAGGAGGAAGAGGVGGGVAGGLGGSTSGAAGAGGMPAGGGGMAGTGMAGAGGAVVVTGSGGVSGAGGAAAAGGAAGSMATGSGGVAGAGGVPAGGGGMVGAGGGAPPTGGAGGATASGGAGGTPAIGTGGAAGAGMGGAAGGGGAAEPTGAAGESGATGGAGGHPAGGGHAGGGGYGGVAGAGGVAGHGGVGQGGQAGLFAGESGCSCEMAAGGGSQSALFMTLLGVALGVRPRRRR